MRLLMTTDTVGGVWTYTKDLTAELLHKGVASRSGHHRPFAVRGAKGISGADGGRVGGRISLGGV